MGKYLSDPPREKANDTYLEWKENVEVYDGCYYFVAVSKITGNYIGTCSTIPSEDMPFIKTIGVKAMLQK